MARSAASIGSLRRKVKNDMKENEQGSARLKTIKNGFEEMTNFGWCFLRKQEIDAGLDYFTVLVGGLQLLYSVGADVAPLPPPPPPATVR